MRQKPSSEANTHFLSQSRNYSHFTQPNIYYCVHNSQAPVPLLNQMNQLNDLPNHVSKINFNNIFPFMPRSSKLSLSFRFHHQNPVCIPSLPTQATYTIHFVLVDLNIQIFCENHTSQSSSTCNYLQFPVTAHLGPNIFLSTLFSNFITAYFHPLTL
jgi:hypothetical protein